MEFEMAASSLCEFQELLQNQLRQANHTIQELEKKGRFVKEDANTLFRFMHNIKSTSSSIGYYQISEAVHHIEDTYFQALDQEEVSGQWKDLVWVTKEVVEYIDGELEKIKTGLDQDTKAASVGYPYDKQHSLQTLKDQIYYLANTISTEQGKKLQFVFDGFSSEIPKGLYQIVVEAILHFVSNAASHGIEKEEKRIKNGKNPVGTIFVSIKRLRGELIIVVDDDGQGIQKHKVYLAAKKQGYVKKPFADYSDSEIYQLLYHFGVTTKKQANLFSGRGIGITAVYKGVSEAGGFVVIDSKEGFGSTFIVKLPVNEE